MKSVLIGSVGTSKILLEEMIKANFPVDMVFCLEEGVSKNVSGYCPIHEYAESKNIPYTKFSRINDERNINIIKNISPDYIFVVGLSQLVSSKVIKLASKGVIGCHPAPLPKFRGRASVVWQMLLGIKESKVTMFMIDDGIDSGDIIGQETYFINDNDYAADVLLNANLAIRKLSCKILPQLMNNEIKPIKQNENEATYTLKRIKEDGKINWMLPVKDIQRLIRAVSKPYPGAYSDYDGVHKIIFWRADFLENHKYIGLPGQIAKKCSDYMDIVGVDGLVRVYDYENIDDVKLIEGHKFK